jgi:hypothetical protein
MDKARPIKLTRMVAAREIAISRPALERARWRCEACHSGAHLRVFEDRAGRLAVLCPTCWLAAGWDPAAG